MKGGGEAGYRKMGRGARFDTRVLTFILSLLVGARFLAEPTGSNTAIFFLPRRICGGTKGIACVPLVPVARELRVHFHPALIVLDLVNTFPEYGWKVLLRLARGNYKRVVFAGVQISGEWECCSWLRFRGEYYLKKYTIRIPLNHSRVFVLTPSLWFFFSLSLSFDSEMFQYHFRIISIILLLKLLLRNYGEIINDLSNSSTLIFSYSFENFRNARVFHRRSFNYPFQSVNSFCTCFQKPFSPLSSYPPHH